jgi:hypothetical protein
VTWLDCRISNRTGAALHGAHTLNSAILQVSQ